MKKINYKFFKRILDLYGNKVLLIEELNIPSMEFNSDADANKYARKALGHNYCANKINEL